MTAPTRSARAVVTLVLVSILAGATSAALAAGAAGSPEADLHFIDGMIDHHQQAIDEATAIGSTAKRPEVRKLASEIVKAQQAEIDQLRTWRQAWFPNAPAAAPMASGAHGRAGGHAAPGETSMKPAGGDPDLAFVEMMIPHHRQAVEMSRDLLGTTTRPELQRLARAIIRDQEREIADMERWRREWTAPR